MRLDGSLFSVLEREQESRELGSDVVLLGYFWCAEVHTLALAIPCSKLKFHDWGR